MVKISDEKLERIVEHKKEQIAKAEINKGGHIFDLIEIAAMKEELLAFEELQVLRVLREITKKRKD